MILPFMTPRDSPQVKAMSHHPGHSCFGVQAACIQENENHCWSCLTNPTLWSDNGHELFTCSLSPSTCNKSCELITLDRTTLKKILKFKSRTVLLLVLTGILRLYHPRFEPQFHFSLMSV